VLRALDGKGRLMLPLEVATSARVPAERDGAVLTVFLPGAAERPRPNFTVVPLPLNARGRLTLTTGVRKAAGIPDGADVYAQIDPERRTVTLTAASRLDAALADGLDRLRAPAPAADDEPAGSDPADSDTGAGPAATRPPCRSRRPRNPAPAGGCASSADPNRPPPPRRHQTQRRTHHDEHRSTRTPPGRRCAQRSSRRACTRRPPTPRSRPRSPPPRSPRCTECARASPTP